VILLDLDDFKGINDTLGHIFGDQVIKAIARRLAEIAGGDVSVSRFGGDEFLILVDRKDALDEVDLMIQKIRSVFSTNVKIDNNDIEIRFSMGISLFPEDGTDVNQLIMNARPCHVCCKKRRQERIQILQQQHDEQPDQ
jgi:diguanylate cyclase (GGDEF)-like protein